MADNPEYVKLGHLRIGVSRWADGWNVAVEVNGKVRIYDPTFPTEAEAWEKARAVHHNLGVALRAQADE